MQKWSLGPAGGVRCHQRACLSQQVWPLTPVTGWGHQEDLWQYGAQVTAAHQGESLKCTGG